MSGLPTGGPHGRCRDPRVRGARAHPPRGARPGARPPGRPATSCPTSSPTTTSARCVGAVPPLADAAGRVQGRGRRRRRARPAAAVPRRPGRRGDLDQRAGAGVRRPARERRAHHDDPHRRRRCATSSSRCSRPPAAGSTCPARSSTPCLPGGERLHVVIPDVTRRHWAVNIRKYVVRAGRLTTSSRSARSRRTPRAFLDAAVARRAQRARLGRRRRRARRRMLNALAGVDPAAGADHHVRGGLRAADRAPRRRRAAVPAAEPRGHRRDPAAPAGQGGAADAPGPARRRRGPRGRGLDLLIALNAGVPGHVHAAREQRRARRSPRSARCRCWRGRTSPTGSSCRRSPRRSTSWLHLGRRRRAAGGGCARSSACPAGSSRASSRPPTCSTSAATSWSAGDGYPPHPERFARAGIDLPALLRPGH